MIDIYQDLKGKTEDLKIWNIIPVSDMNALYRALILAQLTDENKKELIFPERENEFASLFLDYDYKMILRKYKYTDLLAVVLEHFKPESKGVYKKISKAAMLAAKYLIVFSSLDNYRLHLKKVCVDTHHLISFLETFRQETSISALHFNKACRFFQETGLLDIPFVDAKVKDYLIPLTNIEDDNVQIFKVLLEVMKKNKIHGYEINERILALDSKSCLN